MEPNTNVAKTGRFRRGWGLTKSSWNVLRLDKELMALPALSLVCSILAVVILIAGFIATILALHGGHSFSSHNSVPFIILAICFYAVLAIIGNFFSGAVIYGATDRFRGGDPTLRSSLAGARRKLGPLALFSLMMATVGLALQAIEERVPFAGKIAVNLVGAAWSIANVFAVLVIVLSDKNVQPLEATRKSVRIIRKVWGEGVIVNLGISLIGLLSFVGYFGFWVLLGLADAKLGGVPAVVSGTLLTIAILGLIALMVTLSALTGIAKAALYHYATTGEAPELFNRELLQASMTPKKARRIFA